MYALAGMNIGGDQARFFVEGMWRKLDTPFSVGSFERDVSFDGIDWHMGAVWRWGK